MDLEYKSIERIKMASEMSRQHYGKPLVCTYSGGKDSDVMLELFKRSGIPFEVHHSHTTADAPQTVYHIRETFRELELSGIKCNIDYHILQNGKAVTMWNLIPRKLMPPSRIMRYCCSVLKETGCANRMIATGVRWDESNNRANERDVYEDIANRKRNKIKLSDEKMLLTDNDDTRRFIEHCQMKAKTVVNPIIDWKDRDIYDFYWNECPSHNPLYQMGYTRVGCIGCPMASKTRWKEFADFPKYKRAYIRAFERMLERRTQKGLKHKWKTVEEVFLWWMEDKNIPGQMELSEFYNLDGGAYEDIGSL